MRARSWRPLVVAVLVSTASILPPVSRSVATPPTTTAASHMTTVAVTVRATQVKLVTPLDAEGRLRPRYTVATQGHGYCWTTSFLHGRAYRCFKGNEILDPCWKESRRSSVACLLLPWSSRVTQLQLTRRLPATDSYAGATWGLRLGAGIAVNCLVSTGAGGFVGNRHISYYCAKGWVLVGNPDQNQAVWTIATAKRVGSQYVLRGRKPLTIAWSPTVD